MRDISPDQSSHYTFKEEMMYIFNLSTMYAFQRFRDPSPMQVITGHDLVLREKPKKTLDSGRNFKMLDCRDENRLVPPKIYYSIQRFR